MVESNPKPRVCPGCGEKDPSKFGIQRSHKDGLSSRCLICLHKKSKESYRRNKSTHAKCSKRYTLNRLEETRCFIWEYKLNHPCVDCGEPDPRVLQFDRIKGKKKASVSFMAFNLKSSIASIVTEILKCEVRCANCHLKRTWVDRGYLKPNSEV